MRTEAKYRSCSEIPKIAIASHTSLSRELKGVLGPDGYPYDCLIDKDDCRCTWKLENSSLYRKLNYFNNSHFQLLNRLIRINHDVEMFYAQQSFMHAIRTYRDCKWAIKRDRRGVRNVRRPAEGCLRISTLTTSRTMGFGSYELIPPWSVVNIWFLRMYNLY